MSTGPVINYDIGTRYNISPSGSNSTTSPLKVVNSEAFNHTSPVGDSVFFGSSGNNPVNTEKKPETEQQIINELEAQISVLQAEYDAEQSSKGAAGHVGSFFSSLGNAIIGKGWKNGDAKALEEKNALLEAAKKDSSKLNEAYNSIMGEELTQTKLDSVQSASEFANGLDNKTKTAVVETLKEQAKYLTNDIDKSVNGQGIISKGIGWCNNFLGFGTSEKMSRAKIEEYQKLVDSLDPNSDDFAAQYKAITGQDFSKESLEGLMGGNSMISNSFAVESIMDYEETQKMGKDIVCGVGTALAVVAAVPTGGLSLGAVAIGTGVGAGTMVALKATDGLTSAEGYSWEQLARDAASGALQGALVPVTAGVAGTVGKSLGKTALSATAKGTISGAAAGATYGGVYSGGNYIAQNVGKENFSFGDLGKTTLTGTFAGAVGGAAAGATNSLVRPLLTSGESTTSQIAGRLASGGTTGLAAGTTGGFAAGSTGALLNGDENWFNAGLQGAGVGALTGAVTGVAFEGLNIAKEAITKTGMFERKPVEETKLTPADQEELRKALLESFKKHEESLIQEGKNRMQELGLKPGSTEADAFAREYARKIYEYYKENGIHAEALNGWAQDGEQLIKHYQSKIISTEIVVDGVTSNRLTELQGRLSRIGINYDIDTVDSFSQSTKDLIKFLQESSAIQAGGDKLPPKAIIEKDNFWVSKSDSAQGFTAVKTLTDPSGRTITYRWIGTPGESQLIDLVDGLPQFGGRNTSPSGITIITTEDGISTVMPKNYKEFLTAAPTNYTPPV